MMFSSKTSSFSLVSTLALLIPSAISQAVQAQTVFGLSGLVLTAPPQRICNFPNGDFITTQSDGNIVVYTNDLAPLWSILSDGGHLIPGAPAITCPAEGNCEVIFQDDGNFVSYYDGEPLWNAQTGQKGEFLVCQENAPYLYILNAAGAIIWST